MGALFGEDVAVYSEDLHVDHRTHELVVDKHGDKSDTSLTRVATEAGVEKLPSTHVHKLEASHPSVQHVSVVETVQE